MRIPFAGAQCALLGYNQMAEVTLTFSEAIKRVAVACEGRQFREADRIARAILGAQFDALHLIALINARQQRFDEALASYDRGLAVRPQLV